MRLLKQLATGLMMLASVLALQAGSLWLSWDYNFNESPDVTRFKIYCAPGTNVVWGAGNTNATKTYIMDYTGTGMVSNIVYATGGLASGPWTFTATAMATVDGIVYESANATNKYGTNIWGTVVPGRPLILHLTIP